MTGKSHHVVYNKALDLSAKVPDWKDEGTLQLTQKKQDCLMTAKRAIMLFLAMFVSGKRINKHTIIWKCFWKKMLFYFGLLFSQGIFFLIFTFSYSLHRRKCNKVNKRSVQQVENLSTLQAIRSILLLALVQHCWSVQSTKAKSTLGHFSQSKQ